MIFDNEGVERSYNLVHLFSAINSNNKEEVNKILSNNPELLGTVSYRGELAWQRLSSYTDIGILELVLERGLDSKFCRVETDVKKRSPQKKEILMKSIELLKDHSDKLSDDSQIYAKIKLYESILAYEEQQHVLDLDLVKEFLSQVGNSCNFVHHTKLTYNITLKDEKLQISDSKCNQYDYNENEGNITSMLLVSKDFREFFIVKEMQKQHATSLQEFNNDLPENRVGYVSFADITERARELSWSQRLQQELSKCIPCLGVNAR